MSVRQAARVVLLNSKDEVFLLQCKDLGDDTHRWWLTTGGGAEMGETSAQTAARELAEETGIDCEPADLVGPLGKRETVMEFSEKTVVQHEVYYGLRIDEELVDMSDAVWTDVEKASIVGWRWWSIPEIEATSETIYPEEILELVARVRSACTSTED